MALAKFDFWEMKAKKNIKSHSRRICLFAKQPEADLGDPWYFMRHSSGLDH